ncbi:22212_t:CDS:2, partial [Racocetra persica]
KHRSGQSRSYKDRTSPSPKTGLDRSFAGPRTAPGSPDVVLQTYFIKSYKYESSMFKRLTSPLMPPRSNSQLTRRINVTIACNSCRRKKTQCVACPDQLTSCCECIKHNVECIYSISTGKRGRRPKISTGKRGCKPKISTGKRGLRPKKGRIHSAQSFDNENPVHFSDNDSSTPPSDNEPSTPPFDNNPDLFGPYPRLFYGVSQEELKLISNSFNEDKISDVLDTLTSTSLLPCPSQKIPGHYCHEGCIIKIIVGIQ